ncbi:MAG: 2Fe-2S iron-sulfur cluster-binding protein [Erythrobacter sp.]|uniref:2Fe-2S iron-sulfur cluster-binding protein n=1 Tax=Erythrobacter sp. TaxID=1042 RepID=UPI00262EC41E|nr:2Fe-2S iron-sulfur cluster-binding protein [Erythrobacter sp.]MDJ0978183.1 2Fe-2S iron-sulfur cluster-binding protein [Erythrobacter sp.]
MSRRLPTGGVIDRNRTVTFRFNGREYSGHPGDTMASALLAAGVDLVGRSFKYHRPRGLYAAGLEEPNGLVTLGAGASARPNLKLTEIELADGMEAHSVNCAPSPEWDWRSVNQLAGPLLGAGFYYKTFKWPHWHLFEGPIRNAAGLGEAPTGPDPDRYQHRRAHCDVLVIGGGMSGLAAAREAALQGRDVILAETDFVLGGSALWRGDTDTCRAIEHELRAMGNVRILTRTCVFGAYEHGMFAAVEHCLDGTYAERLWLIRAGKTVLATGAIERPMVFADNDRPGVMLASAVHAYVVRFGVLPGQRVVLATNNSSVWPVAEVLRDAGAEVTIVDARSDPAEPPEGVALKAGTLVHRAKGRRRVKAVDLLSRSGASAGALDCDLLAVSGGWTPTAHLYSQMGGKLHYTADLAAFVPQQDDGQISLVGAAAGEWGDYNIDPIWEVPGPGKKFVDLANDVTAQDIAIAAREDYRSVEHLKRYTTLGMGIDQGRTSNVNGLAIMGEHTQRAPGEVGTTRFRPPYSPVTLGTLAGPDSGMTFAPIRYLPAYGWHLEQGALMEEHGPWLRPAAYPRGGEDWQTAAQSEAIHARTGAALFDGSPLGKIEVCGPDAGAFLDRFYVGTASSLKPGRARYGLMLDEHGIIMDDGVFVRIDEQRFLVHTTSGGADRIAAHLEEWHQCEWPDLDVAILPVTNQWAVMTVSGPEARNIVHQLDTDIDLTDFKHMQWREGTIAGLPTRILRASFTGEASYEINVPASHASTLAEKILTLGARPIGIEALMILRTEKGYLHVGVDTDGTTQPQDVGMAGPLKRKTSDFVGRRSLLREDGRRADRLQLVGLNSGDAFLNVGAQVLAPEGQVPGPTDGHVTSSYFSPTLRRPIALALVRAGQARLGEEIELYDMGKRLRATITSPVALDPKGDRLNA